jgi:hypothetical protein
MLVTTHQVNESCELCVTISATVSPEHHLENQKKNSMEAKLCTIYDLQDYDQMIDAAHAMIII